MGAYKYVEELYKKKQSDVLRFLLRVRSVPTYLYQQNTLAIAKAVPLDQQMATATLQPALCIVHHSAALVSLDDGGLLVLS